jgi:hypothetical protein
MEVAMYLISGILGVNVFALLTVAYSAGKQVQRITHMEDKLDHLIRHCPACKPGSAVA